MNIKCIILGHNWEYIYEKVKNVLNEIWCYKKVFEPRFRHCKRCGKTQLVGPVKWFNLTGLSKKVVLKEANKDSNHKLIWEDEMEEKIEKENYLHRREF